MHEVFDLARGFDLAYCSKGFLEIGIWLEGFRPSRMIEVIERVSGQIQPSAMIEVPDTRKFPFRFQS